MQTGDLYVVGAEEFADYRAQLLPGLKRTRLAAYCASSVYRSAARTSPPP